MPYPWATRKIRGAKKKERARKRREQDQRRRTREDSVIARLLKYKSHEEAEKRKKKMRRWSSFLHKYWGIRKRLVVGWYEPRPRGRNRKKRFNSHQLWLSIRAMEQRDWPKERKLRACYIWSD